MAETLEQTKVQIEEGACPEPRPWRSTAPKKEKAAEKAPEGEKKSAAKKAKGKNERRRRVGPNPGSGPNTWLYSPTMYKRRFCAFYPNTAQCKRAGQCAFAHSREEFRGCLLTEEEEMETVHSDDFYMSRYKCLWCPIGVQHDWQQCIYAHNYMDVRRDPAIGYGPRQCPHWDKRSCDTGYAQRCPNGVACPYAHGAKEQLYHPSYFKTVVCWDMMTKQGCPRGNLCAFHHNQDDNREGQVQDDYDYSQPLSAEQMQKLQPDFNSPPPIGADEPTTKKQGGNKANKDGMAGGPPMEFICPPCMPPMGQMPMMGPQMMMVPMFAQGEDNSPKMAQPMMPGGRPGEGPPMMMVPMMMPPQQPPVGGAYPNQMSPQNCAPQPGPMGMMMVPMQMGPNGPVPMEQCMLGPNGMPCSPTTGATSPMSAMDRYTQDILNADGECFDLGYSPCGDKFAGRAGFSDASTDTPHANGTTHSRVHSLSSQSGVMSD
jgi:hypothetical protein